MRIGIVGDIHEPFCHPMYRRFCLDTFAKYRVDHIHVIGDGADNHSISYHESDPNGLSAGYEYKVTKRALGLWYRSMPDATVSIGNHDALISRKAMTHGLPQEFFKSFNEIWGTPGWDWQFEHEFDGVLYTHGTGLNGKNAAINFAIKRRKSAVIGHIHSNGSCTYQANNDSRIFGLSTGCGFDSSTYAAAYGKFFVDRPVLGCGVVLDGDEAFFVPMKIGRGERYNRRRAGKSKRKVLV